MQSGLSLYSNTPSRRRNQLSRAKINLAQGGRLWRFAPGKISMPSMGHTRGIAPRVVVVKPKPKQATRRINSP